MNGRGMLLRNTAIVLLAIAAFVAVAVRLDVRLLHILAITGWLLIPLSIAVTWWFVHQKEK